MGAGIVRPALELIQAFESLCMIFVGFLTVALVAAAFAWHYLNDLEVRERLASAQRRVQQQRADFAEWEREMAE
jgi:hypothetical protein